MTASEINDVGFIGLGAMGLPMAANLTAAGFRVRGYDPRREPVERLAERGGDAAGSEAEAAEGADAIVLMVVNAVQARAALFGANALDAAKPDAAVCLMATCPPGEVATIADSVTQSGRAFIDAPVSGGVVGAEAASLTIMAAARSDDLARVRPLLEAMGSRLVHVGERAGQGAAVKAINQLLCGVHIVAAAEALSLAGRAGVDREVILEILGGSAASSWMLRDRGPRMLMPEPDVTSAVDIFVKDLGIVLETGRGVSAALPLAALAHQMFLAASAAGDGTADDSQVIRAYRRLAGDG